jgi:hypothetical protein
MLLAFQSSCHDTPAVGGLPHTTVHHDLVMSLYLQRVIGSLSRWSQNQGGGVDGRHCGAVGVITQGYSRLHHGDQSTLLSYWGPPQACGLECGGEAGAQPACTMNQLLVGILQSSNLSAHNYIILLEKPQQSEVKGQLCNLQ